MDVPSTAKGVVEKVHVTKGGTVSAGALVVTVKCEGGCRSRAPARAARLPQLRAVEGLPPRPRAAPRRKGESGRSARARHGQFRFRLRHRSDGEAR